MPAIKELIDRLDGKPMQAISGPDGEPITVVQRVIVQQSGAQHTARTIDAKSEVVALHAVKNEIDITPPVKRLIVNSKSESKGGHPKDWRRQIKLISQPPQKY